MLDMGEQQLEVRHQTLSTAALESREAASAMAAKIEQHFTTCTGGSDGWESTDALNQCAQAWAAHLHRHGVEAANDMGGRYHRTVHTYSETELANLDNIGAVR